MPRPRRPSRKVAFKSIQTHIGHETCPPSRRVRETLAYGRTQVFAGDREPFDEAQDIINQNTTITHHMRGVLAGLLVLYTQPDLDVCPNCEKWLSDCQAEPCMLGKVIRDAKC